MLTGIFLILSIHIVDEHHVTARASIQQTAFAIKCYQLYCHVGLPGDIWVLMAAQEASLKVRKAA